MSDPATGAGARTPADDYRALRAENRLRAERLRAHRLAIAEARTERRRTLVESLSLDWVTPYAELLDLHTRTGDPVVAGPSSFWQRQRGSNWPVYRTEAELNLLRAPSRILLATNGYAQGLVEGLTSYVVGAGCTYRAAKVDDADDLPKEVTDACQRVIDDFLKRNQWFGGEQPGLEEELFGRSIEDGEFVLCHYPNEDGTTDVRVQEPEQLTMPPGEDFAVWGFGVYTPRDDTQRVLRYYLQFGDTPDRGEEYDPDEVTHFRRNVRRSMKRGIPDFTFDTYDALHLASRLRTNLGDTAAQQASIVAVRQWENNSQDEIQAFVDGDADFTKSDAITGRQEQLKSRKRGSWEDVPKGMAYVPGPIASSTPIHIQVLDACLRGAGQKWQAPPWLMSGDLNAMNYATSLTAESPFVKTIQRRQRGYCEAFMRPVWFALKHHVRTRGLRVKGQGGAVRVWEWEEIESRVKLMVTAPNPETRNKTEEAQRASIEIPLGVQSRQAYMQEQGRNPDQIEADNQEWADAHGPPNTPLPGEPPPDAGGAGGPPGVGAPGGNPFAGLAESIAARDPVGRALLEAGFTGTLTDSANRTRHYVDGKQVAQAPTSGGAGANPSADAPALPSHETADITAGIDRDLAALPEGNRPPADLVAKAKDVALTAAAKAWMWAVRATPAMQRVGELLGEVVDTPGDMKKLGYNPTITSGTASPRTADAVHAGLTDALGFGVSGHLVASVASRVLVKAAYWTAAKLRDQRSESEADGTDDGVTPWAEMIAGLLGELHDALGAEGAAPDAATVGQALRALLAGRKEGDVPESLFEDANATGLVPKKITVTTSKGVTYQKTVMVKPQQEPATKPRSGAKTTPEQPKAALGAAAERAGTAALGAADRLSPQIQNWLRDDDDYADRFAHRLDDQFRGLSGGDRSAAARAVGERYPALGRALERGWAGVSTAPPTAPVGQAKPLAPPQKRAVDLGVGSLPRSKAALQLDPVAAPGHLVESQAKAIFGGDGPAASRALAESVGMPDDATVTATRAGEFVKKFSDDSPKKGAVGVRVEATHPDLGRVSRFVGVDGKGKRFVRNEILEVKPGKQGAGLGADIFRKQVEASSAEGLDYIETHAVGSFGTSYNGYYTWPQFGYDAPVGTGKKWDAVKAAFPSARKLSVQDIMDAPKANITADEVKRISDKLNAFDAKRGLPPKERTHITGEEWWKVNGFELRGMKFDLTPGSRSMQKIARYLKKKQGPKAAPSPTAAPPT